MWNADALQVYDGWRILTARPSAIDEETAPHRLYGHVPYDRPYSVGDWIRDLAPLLSERLIIVGGTGLYFMALTEGLAQVPETPSEIRSDGDQRNLAELLADIDNATKAAIDTSNRMRVQRAWEVQKATGRSLMDWQSHPTSPILEIDDCTPILLNAPERMAYPKNRTQV